MVLSFSQFIESKSRRLVLAFEHFQTPVIDHQYLLDTLKEHASGSDYKVFVSSLTDTHNHPLFHEERVKLLRKMFPRHGRNIDETPVESLLEAVEVACKSGYKEIDVIVSESRINEIDKLLHKHNHDHYSFERIGVSSRPDSLYNVTESRGEEIKAPIRSVKENDYESFALCFPTTLTTEEKKELFSTIRERIDCSRDDIVPITEENLRDLYLQNKIFLENDLCKDSTGSTYSIIKRGPNFLTTKNIETGEVKKQWLDELQPA